MRGRANAIYDADVADIVDGDGVMLMMPLVKMTMPMRMEEEVEKDADDR